MRPVLVVQHVDWESPHRLATVLARHFSLVTSRPLDGEQLPDPTTLAGAVLMGGSMGVGQTQRHPGLLAELRWIEAALTLELPLLGICLGSQLIAYALGADVTRAPEPELGWRPIEVHAADDPLLGPLAPRSTALHWHGDEFATPPGASLLASSQATACQAFRFANAWGVLFHPEADSVLLASWLSEPAMQQEAIATLGPRAAQWLGAAALRHERALQTRSTIGFEALARIMRARAADPGGQAPPAGRA